MYDVYYLSSTFHTGWIHKHLIRLNLNPTFGMQHYTYFRQISGMFKASYFLYLWIYIHIIHICKNKTVNHLKFSNYYNYNEGKSLNIKSIPGSRLTMISTFYSLPYIPYYRRYNLLCQRAPSFYWNNQQTLGRLLLQISFGILSAKTHRQHYLPCILLLII